MFFCCFGMDHFVHHWGGIVSLGVEVEPSEKWDDFVKHRKDDTECKRGKSDIGDRLEDEIRGKL